MALSSRVKLDLGHGTIEVHPDLAIPWCKTLLSEPSIEWTTTRHEGTNQDDTSNSMFEWTLYGERGIRAHLSFRRATKEPDSIKPTEDCYLLSIGDALDGMTGRAHGGLNSLILDHICGHVAHQADPRPVSPATATLTVNFHRPVPTPCVVLVRAWVIEYTRRKVWSKAVIEDQEGRALASGKALFILANIEKL